MESATLTRRRPGSIRLGPIRAVRAATWAKLAFAVMCVGALIGYFVYPTYPTYDSFYALLWGRDLLHAHLPDFRVYRGPTEHPLAIAFGAFCSIFGDGGARLMVLGSIGSFVAARRRPLPPRAAVLRPARRARRGAARAQPLLPREPRGAGLPRHHLPRPDRLGGRARGAKAAARPGGVRAAGGRRAAAPGRVVAGRRLLAVVRRAEQSNRVSRRTLLLYTALAAIGPLVWVLVDLIVTGKPFYSLTSTSGLAQELGRTQGLAGVIGSLWTFTVRIDKLPVLLGAIAGIGLAVWLAPRRMRTPLAALLLLLGVFVLEGAAGASVIDRYLLGGGRDAAAVLRRGDRRLGDARAGHADAPRMDGRRGAARALRRILGGDDAEPVEPAHDAGLPRGLPQGPRRGAGQPGGQARTEALPAADAAQQQADPRRALDPRHDRPARHRRAQPGAGGRAARARTRSRTASGAAAWRSTRSAAPCSTRRSSTSATTRATRSRRTATTASSRATTTRSMATAERVPALLGAQLSRRWAWPALALILAGGLGLRLWGVQQGLPYAYNADEADHFVPRAVAIFGHDLNPHYFANPPGFTYVLHYLFALAYGGAGGVRHAFAYDPTEVYTLARVAVAVLGVIALWLLYATGARLFGRAAGLLAAAIEAVAFLPVFYSHLALNDVPTLAPLTLSLLGSAGVLRKGRRRDYALAGIGLGLACATKYTAGIALVPLLAAARRTAARRRRARPAANRQTRGGDGRARRGPHGGARVRGLLRGQPVLAARLQVLPRRTGAPVLALGRSPGQARRAEAGRLRLLPVVAQLGARLAAGAGGARRRAGDLAPAPGARLAARAGAGPVPRVHGPAGPLLRPLADADPAAAVPAWRRSSRCGSPAGSPRCSAVSRTRAGLRWRSARRPCWRRCCSRRASSTASTRASCWRARTRAT